MKKLFLVFFSLVLVTGCKNTPSSNSSLEVSSSSSIINSSSYISTSTSNEVSSSNSNELDTSDVLGGNYGELH